MVRSDRLMRADKDYYPDPFVLPGYVSCNVFCNYRSGRTLQAYVIKIQKLCRHMQVQGGFAETVENSPGIK